MSLKMRSLIRSSCVSDWVFIFVLLFILLFGQWYMTPNRQCIPGVTCGNNKDAKLEYPLIYPSSVPTFKLAIFVSFPWIVLLMIDLIELKFLKQMTQEMTNKIEINFEAIAFEIELIFRSVIFSIALCESITELIKHFVGRPRPNYFELMESEMFVKAATKSFPSGHTSLAFSSLFLLTLYLLKSVLYAQNCQNHNEKSIKTESNNNCNVDWNIHSFFLSNLFKKLHKHLILCILISLLPTFVAIYVGCTRIVDYWHHYGDVIAGLLIGVGTSSVSFIMYCPKLYKKIDFTKKNFTNDDLLLQFKRDINNETFTKTIGVTPQRLNQSYSRIESRSASESQMAQSNSKIWIDDPYDH